MIDKNFIWEPWSIHSVDDILRFEDQYIQLVKNTPYEWSPETGFAHPDFGDSSLRLIAHGHFKLLNQSISNIPDDVFILAGCTICESIILHSFLDFYSLLYRLDSYHGCIPPIVHNLCQILDNALEKMPKCKDFELYRACVHEDRSDFAVGDIFEPQYVITTSADSTWQNHDANRFVINPLPPNLTKARSIYHIYNKANEYQLGKEVIEDDRETDENNE